MNREVLKRAHDHAPILRPHAGKSHNDVAILRPPGGYTMTSRGRITRWRAYLAAAGGSHDDAPSLRPHAGRSHDDYLATQGGSHDDAPREDHTTDIL